MLNHFVCENIGIKPGIRGPSMVTGGIIGLMGGFMYAYQNSAGRIMGFFPNDGEVARYKKWHHFFGFFNKSLNLSLFSDKFLFLSFYFSHDVLSWSYVSMMIIILKNYCVASLCIEKTPKNCYFQRPFWFWLYWFDYHVLWISECSVLWYYTSIIEWKFENLIWCENQCKCYILWVLWCCWLNN